MSRRMERLIELVVMAALTALLNHNTEAKAKKNEFQLLDNYRSYIMECEADKGE